MPAIVYMFIVEREGLNGIGYLFIVFPAIGMAVMLVADFLLKRLLKAKLVWIWLIEIILMLVSMYWWIIT